MLILTRSDLSALLTPKEWSRVQLLLREEGSEVFLYTCSECRLYFGVIPLGSDKSVNFDDFLPSHTYMNLYLDLPQKQFLPCPACGESPSIVRADKVGAKIRVFSG